MMLIANVHRYLYDKFIGPNKQIIEAIWKQKQKRARRNSEENKKSQQSSY